MGAAWLQRAQQVESWGHSRGLVTEALPGDPLRVRPGRVFLPAVCYKRGTSQGFVCEPSYRSKVLAPTGVFCLTRAINVEDYRLGQNF